MNSQAINGDAARVGGSLGPWRAESAANRADLDEPRPAIECCTGEEDPERWDGLS